MKHSIIETVEMLAWLLLGVVLGLAMIPAASVMPGYENTTSSPTMFAVMLIGVILFSAFLFWFFSKFWDELPMWFRIGVSLFALVILLYGWSKLAVLGVLFLGGRAIAPPIFSVVLVMVGAAILWYLNVKKLARPIVVRGLNLLMICTIGAISAIISSKLSVVAALVFFVALAVYDAVAVWKMKTMQKMALELLASGIPAGIMIPKKKPMVIDGQKVDVALLGFGDLLLMVVVGGAFASEFGLWPVVGMFAAIVYLFFVSERGKFYPAVPYMLGGCIIGIATSFLPIARLLGIGLGGLIIWIWGLVR